MIKTVIFDIGRVLLGFEWYPYLHELVNDEDKERRITEALWTTGYWHELDRAVWTHEELLAKFYEGAPDLKEEINEAFYNLDRCIEKYDYAIPWIESVKSRGYQVLFLSNMSEHAIECGFRANEAFEFVSHMDGGVYSYEVKLIKPDPAIYHAICEKYDLGPAECIFIDDNKANIEAANKLGFSTVLFDNYEQARAELDEKLAESK